MIVPNLLRPRQAITARLLLTVALLALLLALLPAATPTASAQPGASAKGPFDGDPATTERVDAGDPVTAAVQVSADRFVAAAAPLPPGLRKARHVVLATTASFADSLSGAALTSDGPLLLTDRDAVPEATRAEIARTLGDSGEVYILGGPDAISPTVEQQLVQAGYVVTRLAGATRVETALAVADEVRRLRPSDVVLIARSDSPADNPTAAWADSMTGGALAAAADIPIVVTPTGELHPAVAAWLAAAAPARSILLGGEAALVAGVEDAVRTTTGTTVQRVFGPERTATAAAMAERLWDDLVGPDRGRSFLILNAGIEDGWAFGLAAAGIAADTGAAPLAIVGGIPASTRRLVSTCGDPDVDLVLVGDGTVLSAEIEAGLTDLDGTACASQFTALTPFADCTETLQHFIDEGLGRVGPYGLDGYWYGAVDDVVLEEPEEEAAADGGSPPPAPPAAPAAPEGDGATAGGSADRDTSDTNVQEVGVDEPDIVKTNGAAAYVARGGGVQVVDLTDLDDPVVTTTLDVPGTAFGHELLLEDDVLLVLGRGDGFAIPVDQPPAETEFASQPFYPEPVTALARYDLSDPLDPQLLDTAEIDGDYRSARMVDGIVRVVTSANPTGLPFVFPASGSQEAADAALAHNRQVILDSEIGDWLPALRRGDADGVADDAASEQLIDCTDVFVPPGFSGINTLTVVGLDISQGVAPTSSAAIVAYGETIYASTERLVATSSRWGVWTDEAIPESVSTEVHAFDISDPAETTYVASGVVDGHVLNQFAISELDGYYRIATTTEPPFFFDGPIVAEPLPAPEEEPAQEPGFAQADDTSDNGITILTEGGGELFEVGRVFGLGLGERIFAVRYLGDIAAVVTFRQVDPLYLVDLTNPAAPRVTGELKIPGVSRYLHPLGEDHLLGVGQDGTEDGRLTGLQVSLFDISDRGDPRQAATLEFGPGSSPVEFDHKAFTLWAPLSRAFVPSDLYDQRFFGVQAIDIDTATNTLTRAGAAAQPGSSDFAPSIDRTVVVDDTLLTVSYAGVGSHDLQDLSSNGFAPFPGVQDEVREEGR